MITIAERLRLIARTVGRKGQEDAVSVFLEVVKGHPEEKTLLMCLTEAKLGRTELDFGRNPLLPDSLKDEGFAMKMVGQGFHLCFNGFVTGA